MPRRREAEDARSATRQGGDEAARRTPAARASEPDRKKAARPHWADLYAEVVGSRLCSGCGACVVTCPRGVLGYRDTSPFQDDDGSSAHSCRFGEAGCDACTRACPRFRAGPTGVDEALFGRRRQSDEAAGVFVSALALRAAEREWRGHSQDGGLVSMLLVWALETGRIDGAVVAGSRPGHPLRGEPAIARTRDEILAAAGSRYTYVPNLLALAAAAPQERLALVGVGCQVSGLVTAQQARLKRFRSVVFRIGLMCSETFSEAPFLDGLLAARLGLDLHKIEKVNVKGRVVVSTEGSHHGHLASGPVAGSRARVGGDGRIEIPLSEARPLARLQCASCSDFSAEWSDLSAGGLGLDGWTVGLVRSPLARAWIDLMLAEGLLEARDLGQFPQAERLMQRLAEAQRERPGIHRLLQPAQGG